MEARCGQGGWEALAKPQATVSFPPLLSCPGQVFVISGPGGFLPPRPAPAPTHSSGGQLTAHSFGHTLPHPTIPPEMLGPRQRVSPVTIHGPAPPGDSSPSERLRTEWPQVVVSLRPRLWGAHISTQLWQGLGRQAGEGVVLERLGYGVPLPGFRSRLYL